MKSESIALQDVTLEQAARLAEFGARTFYESFGADNSPDDMQKHLASAWSPEKQLAELRDPDIDTLILADDAGRWLGFAQLRDKKVSDGVPREGSIELWRFYVDKPFQGQGVAAGLMNGAKQRARQRGATSLWLGVWERNERAKAFYARHGFRKVGTQVFVVGSDPQTDDVMLCALA
ncbi:MAG TPA: GNAT family N-acetyltransferase [Steroidobacteraceae bacterium]